MFFNNGLKNATRYYYSETAPEVEGNFWHYDENGNVAVWPEYVPEKLAYTLSEDGTYYIVSGIGTYKSSEVIIPETYNGLPVKEIGASAFANKSITSITIPESITKIGKKAFYNCTRLEVLNFNAALVEDLSYNNEVFYNAGGAIGGFDVTFGNKVQRVPSYLFHPHSTYGASEHKVASVTFAADSICESIGASAFEYSGIRSISLPDSVKRVEYRAFACNEKFSSIKFGNSLESIGSNIFYSNSNIKSITIPASVTSISSSAFYACALESIVFENTSGWSCTNGETTVTLNSSDLKNSDTACDYLKSTYYNYAWKRS